MSYNEPDPGALFPLPTVDDAPHLCVTLSIPADETSISNFIGALYRLALWNNYRRDADKRGTLIAQVWKGIIDGIQFGPCGFPYAVACPYPLSEDQFGWEFVPGAHQGYYTPGIGFEDQDFGPSDNAAIYIRKVLSTSILLTHFEFTYTAANDGSGPDNSAILYYDNGAGMTILLALTLHGGTHTVSWEGSLPGVFEVRISVNSGTATDSIIIFQSLIDGYSAVPYDC